MKLIDLSKYSTDNQKIEYLARIIQKLIDYKKPIFLKEQPIIKWDLEKGYNAFVTLTGNRILDITNLSELKGGYGTLKVIQGTGGSHNLTLPTGSKVVGNGSGGLNLSIAAGDYDILSFYYDEVEVLNVQIGKQFT